jgi:hypothetical protein
MQRLTRILKYGLILIIIALSTACAPSKKGHSDNRRKRASRVHTLQIGRNKFFFSNGYQKKLFKSYKKKTYR